MKYAVEKTEAFLHGDEILWGRGILKMHARFFYLFRKSRVMDKKGKASYYRSCVPFLISLDALKEVRSAPV